MVFCGYIINVTAICYDRGVKALTLKDIPDEVLQRFKAWCAYHGKTMQQALIDYMKQRGDEVRIDSEASDEEHE